MLRATKPLIVAITLAGGAFACPVFSREPIHRPLDLRTPQQDKAFFVLSLLERAPAAQTALAARPALSSTLERKRTELEEAADSCEAVTCIDAALRWTDVEIAAVAQALHDTYLESTAVRGVVDGALRDSGAYVRYDSMAGGDLLGQAWTDAARAMNQTIAVYGEGTAPRHPESDSASFDVHSGDYAHLVHTVASMLAEECSRMRLFFQPTLKYALYLLDINKRDEAGRLEPLEKNENAATLRKLKRTRWSQYPYSVILVPGEGGDRTTWALAPAGKLRIAIAARRWWEGKAPLILVSGGYVHPNQTPFAEALEMKKSLVADYGVPGAAILIDPHARHTTTNLRNAAREIYRYGLPFNRMALIVTDRYQGAYMESTQFAHRCEDELGYLPYQVLRRSSGFDLEWLPNKDALQIDAAGDLLDP